jgi:hypothetical protein
MVPFASTRRPLSWTFALLAALLFASAATAAEPLRWKLTAGEKLNYNVTQDMTMNMNAGPAGQMVTTMQQAFEMTWDVRQVGDDGAAIIQQSVDRIKMSMNAPMGQSFDYDSTAEGPPEGMAAMIAPMYDAMTNGKFVFTMTPRGEISDVNVPPEVLEAIKNSPGAAAMGEMATADGIQKMLMQGSLVLPEDSPVEGESWSNSATMNNPMTGKQTVETSYKFEGMKDVDGVKMAVFRPAIKMGFEGNETMQLKVTEQTSDGEVLFNQDAGRLDSTTLQQTTKIDMTIAGQTMQQQIDQLIEVQVSPAEAVSSEADPTTEDSAPVSSGATTE